MNADPTSQVPVHAFGDDALGEHDAVGIAELIRLGHVSRREVVEAIARAAKVQPALNAIQIPGFQRALDAATATPHAALFSGVPSFIKDDTDVAGLPTNHGSAAWAAKPAKAHSPSARALFDVGMVCLGKSALPEFGLSAFTEYVGRPPARNPWNTGYSTGASSGGSAALVAAGVVPLASANDGGGSTRIPAACCGLVGLKPTRGRLQVRSYERILPIHVVTPGVLTRSVRDTALTFAAAERARPASKLPPIGLVESANPRQLRVGLQLDTLTGAAIDARHATPSLPRQNSSADWAIASTPSPRPPAATSPTTSSCTGVLGRPHRHDWQIDLQPRLRRHQA